MKRREAIQQIALAGVAVALWPGCNTETVPVYGKIPLESKTWKLFQQFAEAIVPVDHETYKTLEPRANYILNIVNDCTPHQEVTAFNNGLQQFKDYVNKNHGGRIDNAAEDDLDKLFGYLADGKEHDPALNTFYETTRNLAKQHFTTSEKYMTEQLEYKFIPGTYLGCVNI
jgi:hypothetical protein